MKTLSVWLLRGVLLCVGAACAYLLAALLLGAAAVHADRSREETDGIRVYLHSNGVHTDLIVPLKNHVFDWETLIRPEDAADGSADVRYAAIGWGDRDFYLNTREWSDLNAATAVRAAFGLNGSLMHVVFLPDEPARGRRTLRLTLSEAEYGRLAAQIRPYFHTGADGRAVPVAAGYGGNDVFYRAQGRYHAFYTCNTWTNERLKKSGLKAVVWTPFAYSVMAAYD